MKLQRINFNSPLKFMRFCLRAKPPPFSYFSSPTSLTGQIQNDFPQNLV